MKRRFHTLLTITTALLMWSCNAFAEGKVAPVANNTTAMNGMAPDDITVCIDTKRVFEDVQKAFSKFYTADDLAKNMKKITSIKYVANADFNESTGKMTVTLVNNEKKTFYNPLLDENARMSENVKVYKANESKRIGKTVWIGNGLHDDEKFKNRTEMLERLAKRLCDIGFDVTYTSTWNDELLFSSDIVLYHGHGGKYKDEKNEGHFINTGIPKRNDLKSLPLGMFISASNNYSINEEYINSKSNYYMKPNSLVYLACCDLLDNNDKMAQFFLKKGAAAVVGYKGEANFSSIGGAVFLDQLSTGNTISEAFDYLKNEVDDSFFTTVIDYASQWKNLDYLKSEMDSYRNKPKDTRIITYTKDENKNIIYNDILGREELKRLYNLQNGDSWDEAAKKNWLCNQDITTWAGVSVNKLSNTISVTINSSNLNLPSDLTLENFDRIEKITLPKDSKVNNLTIQNCMVLTHNPVIACNNLKIKGCPALYGIKLNGAKNVSIDDCEVLKELVISDALEVESLTVSNCKSLNSFECRSVSYSGKPESSLKSLSFKDCDILHSVELHGCPISGTLDLSKCKGLKNVSISVTNIQQIKVGELESLSVRQTPIKQTYESLPGVKKFYVQPKYVYTRMSKFEDEEKIPDAGEGYQYVGDLENWHYYYKLNFDDGSGFYHEGEPKQSKYWNTPQPLW